MEIFLNMSVPFILAYATSQTQACLHLATARGSNTPPLYGELAKGKLSHAPLLCSGVFDFLSVFLCCRCNVRCISILFQHCFCLIWNIFCFFSKVYVPKRTTVEHII